MLCVVIKGPSFEEAHQQISNALKYADLIELRLDYFNSLDLEEIKKMHVHFFIPMIFTLRSQLQGGCYAQSEENRLADIRRLSALKPEYLDIENHVSPKFVNEISTNHPDIKLIYSYHHFAETPADLEGLYREMKKVPAFYYKIAVTAQNSLDAMRLVCWAKKLDDRLIAISMGPHGQVSRILSPVIGCPITYATLDEEQMTAPGQLSPKLLLERYRHHALNPNTALYGLIGDPIDTSISDVTHNALIREMRLDAVYVKIQVKPSELSEFLQYAKQLSFKGLSVTMPLKESILPHLDKIDGKASEMGAVNTLSINEGEITGFNTDGLGALNAIESECLVKGKRIVIIGAGGAAKAIAYEANRRGGFVTIVNRDEEKAMQVAERLHCSGIGLKYMGDCAQSGYDILINCTPIPLPIPPEYILKQAIVMDVKTKPKETLFLQHAKDKGCRVIYGYRMFVEQAVGQYSHWFKDQINLQQTKNILETNAAEYLD